MVALPLFDVVLSSERGRYRSSSVGAELVQSALSDIRHIEKLDESLAPADPSDFDRQTIALVRGMYEDWARQAEGLLERLARLEKSGQRVSGDDELQRAYGRTRAMLSIPLDQLESSHKDAVGGRAAPIEEVRRELRIANH
jgi:hypothetical protein